jgi:ribosome-associated toxin RatA of RatAB toxin-antitoxin module
MKRRETSATMYMPKILLHVLNDGLSLQMLKRLNAYPAKGLSVLLFLGVLMVMALPSLAVPQEDGLLLLSVASPAPVSGMKRVQAKMLIQAPPNLVWETLTNYSDLKNVLPGYERSSVLRAKGPNKLVDIAMRVAAFLPMYRYQVAVQENQADHIITLNRVSGDFKSMTATYRLVPQSNGTNTLLLYTLSIDPGSNMPGSQSIIRANTEKSLKALERHIEQEARKSVIGQR